VTQIGCQSLSDMGNQPTVLTMSPGLVSHFNFIQHLTTGTLLDRDLGLTHVLTSRCLACLFCLLLPAWPAIPSGHQIHSYQRPLSKLPGLLAPLLTCIAGSTLSFRPLLKGLFRDASLITQSVIPLHLKCRSWCHSLLCFPSEHFLSMSIQLCLTIKLYSVFCIPRKLWAPLKWKPFLEFGILSVQP
jgi:hypothetical protein